MAISVPRAAGLAAVDSLLLGAAGSVDVPPLVQNALKSDAAFIASAFVANPQRLFLTAFRLPDWAVNCKYHVSLVLSKYAWGSVVLIVRASKQLRSNVQTCFPRGDSQLAVTPR